MKKIVFALLFLSLFVVGCKSENTKYKCLTVAKMMTEAVEAGYSANSTMVCGDAVRDILDQRISSVNIWQVRALHELADLLADCCIYGARLAEEQKPLNKEKLFKRFYDICIKD